MLRISELPVLDLTVLSDMYGDDSDETVILALSGFNHEAERYVDLLQQALVSAHYVEAARVAHSVKSMAGLCGAMQLSMLCQLIEIAARQQDTAQLNKLMPLLGSCWQALLQQSETELSVRSAGGG